MDNRYDEDSSRQIAAIEAPLGLFLALQYHFNTLAGAISVRLQLVENFLLENPSLASDAMEPRQAALVFGNEKRLQEKFAFVKTDRDAFNSEVVRFATCVREAAQPLLATQFPRAMAILDECHEFEATKSILNLRMHEIDFGLMDIARMHEEVGQNTTKDWSESITNKGAGLFEQQMIHRNDHYKRLANVFDNALFHICKGGHAADRLRSTLRTLQLS